MRVYVCVRVFVRGIAARWLVAIDQGRSVLEEPLPRNLWYVHRARIESTTPYEVDDE